MHHTVHQMINDIRQFGSLVSMATYVLRLGGYSVIGRPDGRIAVVETKGQFYLPGGGQEAGETPDDAAVREAMEECGLRIRIIQRLGIADELVYAVAEQTYFRKRCTFFRAELMVDKTAAGEPDCKLVWMVPHQAASLLRHESQRWAVADCAE